MHFATHVAHCINLKRSNLGFLLDPRVGTADVAISSNPEVEGETGQGGGKYRAHSLALLKQPRKSFLGIRRATVNATRRPPLKQAKTTRGFSIFNGVVVYYESVLERRVSTTIQARNDVAELHSQYPVVTYVGADDRRHSHTFDYYVVFRDGHRVAVAVKHEAKRELMEDLLVRIRAAGISHVADDVVLM